MNTFTPCILPASVRALARVPTMPALAEQMADTMPLLAARPRLGDADSRATGVSTAGACCVGWCVVLELYAARLTRCVRLSAPRLASMEGRGK